MLWRAIELLIAGLALVVGSRFVYLLWTAPEQRKAHVKLERAEEDADVAQTEARARRTQEWADALKDKPKDSKENHA